MPIDRKACKPDLTPLIQALREAIRRAAVSQRKIEERAGFSRGYLSQLLAQNLDLKVWHLLVILDICDVAPGEVFDQVYPRTDDALAAFIESSEALPASTDADLDRLYRDRDEIVADLRLQLQRCEDHLNGPDKPTARAGSKT